jgi:hypothetical protein
MNRYSNLLYKRGFLFTDIKNPLFSDTDSKSVFEKWCSINIDEYKLYYDPSLLIGYANQGDNTIVILGLVLNPFDECIDSCCIASKLLSYKVQSEIKFLEYQNQLSGRFVIISKQGEAIEISNDACATRTVFYDKYSTNTLISSHATLIANLMEYDISSEAIYFFHHRDYENAVMKKLPGLISPYENVYILTPNTKLKFPARKIERIFPYKDNPKCENYDALEKEVADLMITQLKLLNKKTKITLSLTAGIDSRLSLAASKNISNEIDFFTFLTKNETHIEDEKIANKICKQFNLSHHTYRWDNCYSDGLNEFNCIWEKNLGIRRGIMWLNKIYADFFPKDRVHIRSNIAEIVKADSDNYKYDILSAKQLAYLYSTTPMNKNEKVIKKFEEFIEITDFKEENMFNYDYRDLFEWEYKMCQWHSWLLLESDMSHDTFLIYNNREILSKMLSLPYEDRLHRKIFIGIIKRLWSELLEYPVNKKFIL